MLSVACLSTKITEIDSTIGGTKDLLESVQSCLSPLVVGRDLLTELAVNELC